MAKARRQHSFMLFFVNAAFLFMVVVVAQQMSIRNLAATNAVAGDAPEEVTYSVAEEFERQRQEASDVENDYVITDLSEADTTLALARNTSDVGTTTQESNEPFFGGFQEFLTNENNVVAGTLFVSAFLATAVGIYFFLKPTSSDVYY